MREQKGAIDRRDAVKAIVGGAAVCRLAAGLRAQADPASQPPQPGDQLVRLGDAGKRPLTVDDVAAGAKQITAWPIDPPTGTLRSATRLNQVLVLRLDPSKLSAETRTRAADGVVAYTAICTHNGCDVDDWIAKDQVLSCSCHDSQFDPANAAAVVDGPAPRPLPSLPLKIVDGVLTVAAPFTAKVGFEKG